ncbi:hypothetical protein ACWERY_22390 [Streptomyces sp. NPDC004082]|uniref:hypothetical protein n=1 Tax=unclassified Streptomyces TaxID=2593676 RepID=UPI0033AC53EA
MRDDVMTSAATSEWVADRIRDFCERYKDGNGEKLLPLGAAVPLSGYDLDQVRSAVPEILRAKGVILRHLLSVLDQAAVLDMFGIPAQLLPWMPVLQDPEGYECPVMRVDLIPLADGTVRICELNLDSSVGGPETGEFRRYEELAAGLPLTPTPYEQLARQLAPVIKDKGLDKVCLLDWSTWEGYGQFDLEWMRQTLAHQLPAGIEVFLATEKKGAERIDAQTLVYRVFMADDALDDVEFVAGVFARAGHVIGDFSGEVIGSKVWMGLLHEPEYRALLPESTCAAIDALLPQTRVVTAANIDTLIAGRSGWFFKSAADFGGAGVIDGRTVSEAELRERLAGDNRGSWIAQEVVEPASFDVTPLGSADTVSRQCVLGLYRYGDMWSGCFLRSASESSVINMSAGASVSWAYEVPSVEA